jgi:alkylation response protein AidB-like acyl-CoA dehydrogenase
MTPNTTSAGIDWVAVARDLGPAFASRAAALDANDSFAAENFRELREHRVFAAPIPTELGGGGASYPELCAMLRELGRHCGATALSLSMHMHLVATSVYQYHKGAPVAPLLERIAAGQLVAVTSGASDWLESSGTAERVEGGFLVTARKPFVSGSPAGNILITSAVYDDPEAGATVLQFSTPMQVEGVTVLNNWRTMAMRASGSNDVVLDRVFVPDAAVAARRSRGAWSPMLNLVAPIVIPLVMSVYLGVAETARRRKPLVCRGRDGERAGHGPPCCRSLGGALRGLHLRARARGAERHGHPEDDRGGVVDPCRGEGA